MDDAEQIAAYTAAGTDLELMTCTHVLHAIHAARLIPPGASVLDLGCGPATQMVHLARLRPDIHITGVDLSTAMLEEGQRQVHAARLSNLTLVEGDMTDLAFPDEAFDAVVSSMALHHLPTREHLHGCLREIERVLLSAGAIYLGDFVRYHRDWLLRRLAFRRRADQPEAYTRDFHNSLRAAFSGAELTEAFAGSLLRRVRLRTTAPLRFMMAAEAAPANPPRMHLKSRLAAVIAPLSPAARRELRLLRGMFHLGAWF